MPGIFTVLLCLVNVVLKTRILLTEFMRHYALSEELFLSRYPLLNFILKSR